MAGMMNLPSVAGVLNFQNFANQLANANAGVKNAISLANDWMKTKQAQDFQTSEAQKQRDFSNAQAQSQRDFTMGENEKNRAAQAKLQSDRLDAELRIAKANKEVQDAKENAAFKADAQPVIGMQIDETNENAIRDKLNRLQSVIEKAKARGDNDTLGLANAERLRLGGFVRDGVFQGGVLQQVQEANKQKKVVDDTNANIKDAISAGATDSALAQMNAAKEQGLINDNDYARYAALLQAKKQETMLKNINANTQVEKSRKPKRNY